LQPGTVYRESDCRICQCVDNFYSCDESACDSGEKEEARLLPSVLTGKKKKPKPVETGGFPSLEQPTTPEGLRGMVGPVMGRPGRPPGMVAPPGMPRPGRPPGMVGPAAGVVGMAGQPILLSTVTPPKKCDEDHFVDLIQGDQALPDVVFNASSVLSDAFRPSFAKFTPTADSQSEGSWSPQYSDNHQYLEIDLGQQEPIYGIKIKGSPVYDEYVTSYKVYYSPDAAGMFFPVLNKQNLPQVHSTKTIVYSR
jgi:hypothetical protein